MVGRQTPFLALLVPLIIVAMIDGRRGIRQTWPVALVGGLTFAIGQFATSNYVSAELTDIVAALISVASIVLLLRVWQPPHDELPVEEEARQRRFARPGPAVAGASTYNPALEEDVRRQDWERAARPGPADEPPRDGRGAVIRAYAPYAIIILVLGVAQWSPVKDELADREDVKPDEPLFTNQYGSRYLKMRKALKETKQNCSLLPLRSSLGRSMGWRPTGWNDKL